MTAFPRFFVPLSEAEPVAELHAALVSSVLDAFRWVGRGTARDVAVVRDLSGALSLWTRSFEDLPFAARAAISHHELAVGALRAVAAEEIWLLDGEAVEQVPDTPGPNDPIYVRGRMSGPWTEGTSAATGRLALTRADLLAGIVDGEPDAFRLAEAPSAGGGAARVLHAAVPGGRAEEIANGAAYVLAFPLVPFELQPGDAANEGVVAQVIHDLLGALKADLTAAKTQHWLVREALPVPSRADLVDRLVGEGWEVHGNIASHRAKPRGGFTGFLSMALGTDYDKRIALPPEASAAEFLALATRTIESFPGFPDERAQALARRVGAGPAARITQPIALPPPRFAARPKGEAEEWQAEFERAFAAPGAPPAARVTPLGKRS